MSWFNIVKSKKCPKCGTQMQRSPQGILRRRTGKWFCPKCKDRFKHCFWPSKEEPTDHEGKPL